ncbi:MAG TPA: thioredoxin family protein [Rhodocyclaceae bacterium]|nr:thioredoxin family protein [Rhodocyclaceae bacterium]
MSTSDTPPSELLVVCLCAEWCGVCREYRSAFDGLARERSDAAFHWIDVEADAERVGDLEVENFPTILIQRGESVLFYGTMLPQPVHLRRAIDTLAALSPDEARARAAACVADAQWQAAAALGCLLLEDAQRDRT